MKKSRIREYFNQIGAIYLLLDYEKTETEDELVMLFHELTHLIIYGDFNQLISYAKRAYDVNIPTKVSSPLQKRIETFILSYLNDVIEESLLKTLK